MSLNKLENEVCAILESNPASRDDDIDLYLKICTKANPLAMARPFAEVMRNRNILGLPNFDSVTRCRRKLQEKIPALRPSANACDRRYKHYKEVLEYVGK